MAALVVAALAQVGDRPAWLVAILADRFARPGTVLAAAALGIAAAGGIAVTGGVLVAPMLTPAAGRLLLALALLMQGGGAVVAVKPPDRLAGWRTGAFATSAAGLFVLAFGDGIQFVVLALAARSATPWLALPGVVVGSLAVFVPAAMLGERAWAAAPLVRMRQGIGAVFVVVALVLGLGALRLI